jgi:hypothetical protein
VQLLFDSGLLGFSDYDIVLYTGLHDAFACFGHHGGDAHWSARNPIMETTTYHNLAWASFVDPFRIVRHGVLPFSVKAYKDNPS